MKNNKRGFTLIELLVAGTIIGILAIFATIAYRNSVVETRLAGAKAKLELLANARQRFDMDHPEIWLYEDSVMQDVGANLSCPALYQYDYYNQNILIHCGYLENQGWGQDEYFEYSVCDNEYGTCLDWVSSDAYWACLRGKSNAKLPDKYKQFNYIYCVGKDGAPVEFFN